MDLYRTLDDFLAIFPDLWLVPDIEAKLYHILNFTNKVKAGFVDQDAYDSVYNCFLDIASACMKGEKSKSDTKTTVLSIIEGHEDLCKEFADLSSAFSPDRVYASNIASMASVITFMSRIRGRMTRKPQELKHFLTGMLSFKKELWENGKNVESILQVHKEVAQVLQGHADLLTIFEREYVSPSLHECMTNTLAFAKPKPKRSPFKGLQLPYHKALKSANEQPSLTEPTLISRQTSPNLKQTSSTSREASTSRPASSSTSTSTDLSSMSSEAQSPSDVQSNA